MSVLLTQLEGGNLVHDVGYLEGGKTGYLPFLVICNDIISMARYTGAGTRVTSETMAVDVIDDVGPGGNYITHPHTAKHFREEIWQPHTFIRYMWDQWEAKGKKSCFDLAKDRVHDVLAQHQPVPLSDDACVKMNETISRRQSECED